MPSADRSARPGHRTAHVVPTQRATGAGASARGAPDMVGRGPDRRPRPRRRSRRVHREEQHPTRTQPAIILRSAGGEVGHTPNHRPRVPWDSKGRPTGRGAVVAQDPQRRVDRDQEHISKWALSVPFRCHGLVSDSSHWRMPPKVPRHLPRHASGRAAERHRCSSVAARLVMPSMALPAGRRRFNWLVQAALNNAAAGRGRHQGRGRRRRDHTRPNTQLPMGGDT